MNREKAHAILQLEPGASVDDIKKAYRLLALRYHPDKSGNSDMFILVKDAYEYLIRDTNVPVNFSSILDALMQNERFKDIITELVLKAETKIFASISPVKRMAIYKILVLYKDYLHLSDSFLNECSEILNKESNKVITEYIVLNPTIEDLLGQRVYKNAGEYIPLWHRRVLMDSVVVDCVFDLPDWIRVDDRNNVYIEVNREIVDILKAGGFDVCGIHVDGSDIKVVKNQCIQLVGRGIPVANKDDIYDVSVLSDVFVHLELRV